MERAIFISKVENLKYCSADFNRVYFGNEFCQRLIPSVQDIGQVLNFASENNQDFTFVTPYVTNEGLRILEPLLMELSKAKPGSEVVFNDWGVLQILNQNYHSLEPVMGRLLNKMKRGPRLMNVLENLPESTVEYFRSSNLTVPIVGKFLNKNRIKRVELDNLLQGINLDFGDLEASLYIPFAYVTTTRLCLVNSCDVPEKRGIIGIFPCGKECQKYTFYLMHPVMPVTLIRKGNTIFFVNDKIPGDLGDKITRIVIEPEIPM